MDIRSSSGSGVGAWTIGVVAGVIIGVGTVAYGVGLVFVNSSTVWLVLLISSLIFVTVLAVIALFAEISLDKTTNLVFYIVKHSG